MQQHILLFPIACALYRTGPPFWGLKSGKWITRFTLPQSSAQRAELAAVVLTFQLFAQQTFNLIVDTTYTYNLLFHLPAACITTQIDSNLMALFLSLHYLPPSKHS